MTNIMGSHTALESDNPDVHQDSQLTMVPHHAMIDVQKRARRGSEISDLQCSTMHYKRTSNGVILIGMRQLGKLVRRISISSDRAHRHHQKDRMKHNCLRSLITVTLFSLVCCAMAVGQGGSFGQPNMVWQGVSATQAWGTNTVAGGYARTAQAPVYSSGIVAITITNMTGAPSACNFSMSFGGQTGNANSGVITTANYAPANNVTQYLRLTTTNAGPFGNYTTGYPQWACATFPTTGTMTVEFVSDSQPVYVYYHASTNTTQTLKSFSAFVHTVTINNPGTTEVITLFDNGACSGTVIAAIVPTVTVTLVLDVQTTTGLCVQTSGTTAGDTTVTYR